MGRFPLRITQRNLSACTQNKHGEDERSKFNGKGSQKLGKGSTITIKNELCVAM